MVEKTHVRAEKANLLYRNLICDTGVSPGSNFHKHFIARNGKILGQFPSQVSPQSPVLRREIKTAVGH